MIEFFPNDVIVMIYEGNSEKNISEILLMQNSFLFEPWQLLDGRMFKRTNTHHRLSLENQYFPMDFGSSRLVVLLIQDDNAGFKINDFFLNKITGPLYVQTKPEIEMLMIHSLGLYRKFHSARAQNHQLKPSQFAAGVLGVSTSRLKSKEFIHEFYRKYSLADAIKRHAEKAKRERDIYFLADIIK
jgi:hypothetical protein